jgi:hypothetical protein
MKSISSVVKGTRHWTWELGAVAAVVAEEHPIGNVE